MTRPDLRNAAETARDLVGDVGKVVRGMQAGVEVRDKGNGLGPVTDADLHAEALLIAGIEQRFPGEAILSEETRGRVDPGSPRIWCVDPIDGTREYSQGLDEYAIHVGLLVQGVPRAGAIALPGLETVFWGWDGGGCFQDDKPLHLAEIRDLSQATAIRSRSHTNRALSRVIAALGVREVLSAGSVGYKVAQILLGRAHIYVHTRGGTAWWDSVAPAAILGAGGGGYATGRGAPLDYTRGQNHAEGLLFTAPGLLDAAVERLR